MKKIYTLLFMSLFCVCEAQYDIDINKKTNKLNRRDSEIAKNEKIGFCKFVPYHDYVIGMKFYFPNDERKINSDYADLDYYKIENISKKKKIQTKIFYKEMAGKVFEIKNIERRNTSYSYDDYFTLKDVASDYEIEFKSPIALDYLKEKWNKETYSGQNFVLPSAIYVNDVDNFKTEYIGKYFYSNIILNGLKFQKLKVINVGAGSFKNPIRVVLEDEQGNKNQIDVSTCGNNLPEFTAIESNFSNFLLLEDPKVNYSGKFWNTIIRGKIEIGMSENDLILAWGRPEKINKTVSNNNTFLQFVYPQQYVYVDNGFIVSYQSPK